MKPTKTEIARAYDRLFSHVTKNAAAPHCWRWTARTVGRGYGQLRWFGRMTLAHRLTYEQTNGPIPAGLIVRHTCDNPGCVNPEHLVLGTHKDNAYDRDSRGRATILRGERHGQAKVTGAIVRKIRKSPEPLRVLSSRFGISMSLASQIRCSTIWKHIPTVREFPAPSGERHHRSKLTDAQVLQIRESPEKGTDLARKLSVSPALISAIRTNKHRNHA